MASRVAIFCWEVDDTRMNWRLIAAGTDILVCYYFDWRCDTAGMLSYVCEK